MRPSGEKRTDATPLLCPLMTSFSVYGTYTAFLGEGKGVGIGVVSRGVVCPGVAVELREDLWGESLLL